jgi:hypothetical protein
MIFDIYRDGASTTGGAGIGQLYGAGGRVVANQSFTIVLTIPNTSAHTYDIYFNSANGGNTFVGNGVLQETMTIQEVTNP